MQTSKIYQLFCTTIDFNKDLLIYTFWTFGNSAHVYRNILLETQTMKILP